jgi:hypothetical protein
MMTFDFERWRREYPTSSFADQQVAWDALAAEYPEQVFWHGPVVARWVREGDVVVELGGWRGELADWVIPRSKPLAWVNYDICPSAVKGAVCAWPEYRAVLLGGWPWEVDLGKGNVFVATHVIEHMLFWQFQALAGQFRKFGRVVLESPIVASAVDFSWVGNGSTHILEVGWAQVEGEVCGRGFKVVDRDGDTRVFQREGQG